MKIMRGPEMVIGTVETSLRWDTQREDGAIDHPGQPSRFDPYPSCRGKIRKKKDTPESRAFWEGIEAVSKEVDTWPEWKKAFARGYTK